MVNVQSAGRPNGANLTTEASADTYQVLMMATPSWSVRRRLPLPLIIRIPLARNGRGDQVAPSAISGKRQSPLLRRCPMRRRPRGTFSLKSLRTILKTCLALVPDLCGGDLRADLGRPW